MKKNFKRKITALIISGAITLGTGGIIYSLNKKYIPNTSITVQYQNQYFSFDELVVVYKELWKKAEDISLLSNDELLELANNWKKLYASCKRIQNTSIDEDFFKKYQYYNMRYRNELENIIINEIERRHLLATPQNDNYIKMDSYFFNSQLMKKQPINSEVNSIEKAFIKNYMENTDEVRLQDIRLVYDTMSHYYYCMYYKDNNLVIKTSKIFENDDNDSGIIFALDEAKKYKNYCIFSFNLSSSITEDNDNKISRIYFRDINFNNYNLNNISRYYLDIEREFEIIDTISDEELIDLCKKWICLKNNYERLKKENKYTEEDFYYSYNSFLENSVKNSKTDIFQIGTELKKRIIQKGLISSLLNSFKDTENFFKEHNERDMK